MAYREPFEIEPPFLIFVRHPLFWFRLCLIFGVSFGVAVGASRVIDNINYLRANPDEMWPRTNFVLLAESLYFGFLLFLFSLVCVLTAWGVASLWKWIRR